MKVMWTNSRISELPLQKALSTAMSHLWSIVAVCCSLLGINKEEQVFRQANQTQSLLVFILFWVKYLWDIFGFTVQGSRCLWSMFVVSDKQSSCIPLPRSFHSAHMLWMGRYKQGTVFFMVLLRKCAPLQLPFHMCSVGVVKGSCSSALELQANLSLVWR